MFYIMYTGQIIAQHFSMYNCALTILTKTILPQYYNPSIIDHGTSIQCAIYVYYSLYSFKNSGNILYYVYEVLTINK